MQSDLEIRSFDPTRDIDAVAGLYDEVWGSDGRNDWREDVRWAFVDAPNPAPMLVAAEPDGRMAAVRGAIAWTLTDGLESTRGPVRALQARGTAVSPRWRRKGLFSDLTSRYVEMVTGEGFDLIFNVSVPAAMAGYQKLGWTYVRSLVTMARPVGRTGSEHALQGHRPWSPVGGGRSRRSEVARAHYDSAAAQWRLSRSDRHYGVCGPGGEVPYSVYERGKRKVIEFGSLPAGVRARDLRGAAHAEGASLMLYKATLPSPGLTALRRWGFVPVSRLRLGRRLLSDRWEGQLPRLEIQGIDIDTF